MNASTVNSAEFKEMWASQWDEGKVDKSLAEYTKLFFGGLAEILRLAAKNPVHAITAIGIIANGVVPVPASPRYQDMGRVSSEHTLILKDSPLEVGSRHHTRKHLTSKSVTQKKAPENRKSASRKYVKEVRQSGWSGVMNDYGLDRIDSAFVLTGDDPASLYYAGAYQSSGRGEAVSVNTIVLNGMKERPTPAGAGYHSENVFPYRVAIAIAKDRDGKATLMGAETNGVLRGSRPDIDNQVAFWDMQVIDNQYGVTTENGVFIPLFEESIDASGRPLFTIKSSGKPDVQVTATSPASQVVEKPGTTATPEVVPTPDADLHFKDIFQIVSSDPIEAGFRTTNGTAISGSFDVDRSSPLSAIQMDDELAARIIMEYGRTYFNSHNLLGLPPISLDTFDKNTAEMQKTGIVGDLTIEALLLLLDQPAKGYQLSKFVFFPGGGTVLPDGVLPVNNVRVISAENAVFAPTGGGLEVTGKFPGFIPGHTNKDFGCNIMYDPSTGTLIFVDDDSNLLAGSDGKGKTKTVAWTLAHMINYISKLEVGVTNIRQNVGAPGVEELFRVIMDEDFHFQVR